MIGWAEFWASLDEAEKVASQERRELEQLMGHSAPQQELDALSAHERYVAHATGRPSPFLPSLN